MPLEIRGNGTDPGNYVIKKRAKYGIDKTFIAGVLSATAMAGGFATWLLSEARASSDAGATRVELVEKKVQALDAGLRDEMRNLRVDFEARQRQTEQKIDKVLDVQIQLLKEMRRR